MNQIIAYFDPFPNSAKNGIISLVAAWMFFLISLYSYYLPGELPFRIMIIAIGMCYIVVKVYNWGRILCLVSNLMLIVWCVIFAMAFFNRNQAAFAASILNVALFSAATYFLWIKESAEFFKTFRINHQADLASDGNHKKSG